ncbi:hypothetical protein V8E54_013514 [Elaphomyces granulatus]
MSTGETLGGFYQGGALTESSFLSILGNIIRFLLRKHRESGQVITPSQNPVVTGNYDVYSDDAFRDGVRARDMKCVTTGNRNRLAQYGRWEMFQVLRFPVITHFIAERSTGHAMGTTVSSSCRDPNDPNRVSEELLRWHFRQCAGEPIFETDSPPGEDMMATLRAEPYGKERFEMEWRLEDRG